MNDMLAGSVAGSNGVAKVGEDLASRLVHEASTNTEGAGAMAAKGSGDEGATRAGDPAHPSEPSANFAGEEFRTVVPHRRATLVHNFELPLVLIGTFAPSLMVGSIGGRNPVVGAVPQTSAAICLAVVIAWYVLSRLKTHANARHLSYVIPVNFVAFSGVFTAMALLRIPYSGTFFLAGASSALLMSFLTAVYGRRLVKPHLVVPGGRAAELNLTGLSVVRTFGTGRGVN